MVKFQSPAPRFFVSGETTGLASVSEVSEELPIVGASLNCFMRSSSTKFLYGRCDRKTIRAKALMRQGFEPTSERRHTSWIVVLSVVLVQIGDVCMKLLRREAQFLEV